MTRHPPDSRKAIGLALAGCGLAITGTVLFAVIAIVLRGRGWGGETDLTVPALVEFPAPTLTLTDLTGRQESLSDYRGRVVLVNIWATWCPPCREEMPAYEAFYREHDASGFTVIAINDGEALNVVAPFARSYGLTFPIWLDPGYQASERAFRTEHLPSSYVIDRVGTVRLMWIGSVDRSILDQYVGPLIKE